MRRVVVCPTDFLFRLFQGTSGNSDSWVFLVSDGKTRTGLSRQDANALAGPLDDPGLYRRAHLSSGGPRHADGPGAARRGPSLGRILETILEVAPEVPVLVVHQGARPPSLPHHPNVSTVMLGRTMRDVLRPEMDRALLRVRIEQMRHLLAGKDRVGILLQDDPDPDAMASGLALRALLGRTRATAPLLSFGRVTRPENLAMVEALEIEVDQITPEGLRAYDALAMVDVQPAFCEEALPQIAVVIDHHPEAKGWRAPFRDVRPTLRRDVDHHDRVPARGRREDHGAGRDRALLRHQDGHAPPRAERHPGGHAGLRLPLRAGQPQHPAPDRAPRAPARRARRAGRRAGAPDDHPERALRPPGPGQPARSHPAVRGPVPPGQGHRVVRRLRPDGRRGAHLGPQRRLRPGGGRRRAERVRRARLGRRPPLGREGGDPGERLGRTRSGRSRRPPCGARSSTASSTPSTGASPTS